MITSFLTPLGSKLAALLSRQQRASFRRPLVLFAGIPVLFLSFLTPLSPATAATPASGYWTVAAGGQRSVVFAATPVNTPTLENGSYFYFLAGQSIGFAPNSTINQASADVENSSPCDAGNGDLRLSWHISGAGGWRAGCSTGLNGSPQPRAVYQSSSSSSLFTGPAKNVSHQTLLDNGWSLCYDDTYAFALATDGSDLTSACTQTYVLLAGGNGVAGPQPSFPSASSPAEAEVEAGPPGIALTVPNALGRDSAGLPIYFGSHKTSSYGDYSLELTGPQGRTVLASGKSSVYGGYDGMVRLPAGLPGGSYVLSLKNTSAAGIPLVLKVNLTLDASSRLQSHSPG
jgi:hypothetical protein